MADSIFKNLVWDVFDPSYAAALLSDNISTFPGHREILQRAFFAWLAAPNDQESVRDAIVIGCTKLMLSASTDDVVVSLSGNNVSKEFEEEILVPIGGLARLLETKSQKTFLAGLHLKSAELTTLSSLVHVMHIANELGQTRFYPPSFRKAAQSLVDMHSPKNEDSNARPSMLQYDLYKPREAQTLWQTNRSVAAMVYTSRIVEWRANRSLFSTLWRTGYANPPPNVWRDWLGKARYISEFVLNKIPTTSGAEPSFFLQSVPPATFAPPIDPEIDVRIIKDIFRR